MKINKNNSKKFLTMIQLFGFFIVGFALFGDCLHIDAAIKECSKDYKVQCAYGTHEAYNLKLNSEENYKFIARFSISSKNEDIKFVSFWESYKSSGGDYGLTNGIDNTDFLDDDGNYYCPNEILYWDKSGVYGGDTYYYFFEDDVPYYIAGDDIKVPSSEWQKLKLNEASSCLAKKNESQGSKKSTNNQYNVCYYKNNILTVKDGKMKLSTENSRNNRSDYDDISFSYDSLRSGICPNYMCTWKAKATAVITYKISYDTTPPSNLTDSGYNCIEGISYDNDFKCVILSGLYNKILENNPKTVNNAKIQMQSFCKQKLSNSNYTKNNRCLLECLTLNDKLAELEGKLCDSKNDQDCNDCGLSDQIIAFIYNILKWVKYIAPVLVIILGILDFVKALAAQDDDAMKKAQGKFVKRLIAAVLLFLLPLIIDYVLSVFHFNDSCNINEIF